MPRSVTNALATVSSPDGRYYRHLHAGAYQRHKYRKSDLGRIILHPDPRGPRPSDDGAMCRCNGVGGVRIHHVEPITMGDKHDAAR